MSYKSDFNDANGWSAIDCSTKLDNKKGKKFLDFLAAKDVSTVIRYYAASKKQKTLSRQEAELLTQRGFFILPVYQDNNTDIDDFSKAKGRFAAEKAREFAEYIGQPKNKTILFAVDRNFEDADIQTHIVPHFEAINAKIGGEYTIGAYGCGAVLEKLLDTNLIEVPWLSMSRRFNGTKDFFYSNYWALRQVYPSKKHGGSGINYDRNVLNWMPEQISAFNTVEERAIEVAANRARGDISSAGISAYADDFGADDDIPPMEARAVIGMGFGVFDHNQAGNKARNRSSDRASPSFFLSELQERICKQVINVYETGSVAGDYGAISIYKDGPGGRKQITYGRSQTTEYGNLSELVEMYIQANGKFASELSQYVGDIGVKPLVNDNAFKYYLQEAGNADPVMREVQDSFFDKRYFNPAMKWAAEHGFTKALSALVIYDSFIHSGSIRTSLRNRFPEKTPVDGGDEYEWIRQYIDVRHNWLSSHSNSAVRASVYRTRDLAREISVGNWDLSSLPIMANGSPVRGDKLKAVPVSVSSLMAGARTASTSLDDGISLTDAGFLAHRGLASAGADEAVLRELAVDHELKWPTEQLIKLRNTLYPTSRPRYWAIVNFDLHSAKPRLFVFDVVEETVDVYLCAHGKGSEGVTDDGMADVFSNVPGSEASSLGIYRCAETYQGQNGYSLKLDGLEDTNSNARSRAIVMHGAYYVSPDFVANTGRIGRSQGCPAIDHEYTATVIDQLKNGSFLMHWKAP